MRHIWIICMFSLSFICVLKQAEILFFPVKAVNECSSSSPKSFCSLSDNYSSFLFFYPLPHPSWHSNLESMKKPKANQQENNKQTLKSKSKTNKQKKSKSNGHLPNLENDHFSVQSHFPVPQIPPLKTKTP